MLVADGSSRHNIYTMSRDPQRSLERGTLLYELLTDEGVYDANDFVDEQTRRDTVRQAINDLVEKSEEFYGSSKSQITRNIGRAAFLHSYIAGEDEETLRKVVAELGWSGGHSDLDKLAITSLLPYPKLLRAIQAAQETPAEPALPEIDLPQRDLDEIIFNAIKEGRIPQGYGGLLRLYFGKVEAPATTKPEVLHAAYSQAGGKLKIDVARRAKVNDMPSELVRGFKFLERYNAGFDIPAIAQEEFPVAKKNQTALTDAINKVESFMALALEELYK